MIKPKESIRPKLLQKGDTIGIVAPAGKIAKEGVVIATKTLKDRGYKVVLGEHIFNESSIFAGNDNERAEDFQLMLDNPEISLILCARGGYGSVRIIQELDFTNYMRNPKWISGFSDITVFHSFLSNQNIESLHSIMPVNFSPGFEDDESFLSWERAISYNSHELIVETNSLNILGKTEGIIVGGNLSILISLLSTPFELLTDDRILFIEDVGEYLYHLDRLMMNLKLSGKLGRLRGLIVGGMTEMKEGNSNFGKTAYEIISGHCSDYSYPICFGFPAGHQKQNYCLRMGANVQLHVNIDSVKLASK